MKTINVICANCKETFFHNPRQIIGCGCDPDSPTWCYIERDGTVKGFSQSKWVAKFEMEQSTLNG